MHKLCVFSASARTLEPVSPEPHCNAAVIIALLLLKTHMRQRHLLSVCGRNRAIERERNSRSHRVERERGVLRRMAELLTNDPTNPDTRVGVVPRLLLFVGIAACRLLLWPFLQHVGIVKKQVEAWVQDT